MLLLDGSVDRGERFVVAQTQCVDAARIDRHDVGQPLFDRFGAGQAELRVVFGAAERIGVTLDAEAGLRVAPDQLAEFFQTGDRFGPEEGLVVTEEDIGRHEDGTGRTCYASGLGKQVVEIAVTGGQTLFALGAGLACGAGQFDGGLGGRGGLLGQQGFGHRRKIVGQSRGARGGQSCRRIARSGADRGNGFGSDGKLSRFDRRRAHLRFFRSDVFLRQFDRRRSDFAHGFLRGCGTVVEQSRVDVHAVDFESAGHNAVVIGVAENFHLVTGRPPDERGVRGQ